ncbi:MAG: rRNA maturation RNase YbeY [Bacteroidales bacterium]|nr:rRNA maturation RNase YbeY [Bacteroidales bacterium]
MSKTPKIYFFLEEVTYTLKNKRLIREWLLRTVENEGYTIGALNYIFTSDNILLQLNKEYLRHFTLTDIITFDLAEKQGELTGDIFISIDRARENAREFKVSLSEELNRLMIHGVLHLIGYKDKTQEEKEIMRAKEEFYLSLPPWS